MQEGTKQVSLHKMALDKPRFATHEALGMMCELLVSSRLRMWASVAAVLSIAACDPAALSNRQERPEPGVQEATRNGPPGAAEGTCWGRTVSPAVVQTVTRQVQIRPAQVNEDGTIAAPPKYRTETVQEIVSPRRDNWFETPCAEVLTEEFVSSLQRALLARGYYAGAITGKVDLATRFAVQAFQKDTGGPDSGVLTLAAARTLGLIAVPRSGSE